MIERFSIDNFKSITRLDFRVSPLSILVGPNSSGKTSVLQALALLKQSLEELGFNGPWAKLGSFKDAVHNHDDSASIHLSIRFVPRVNPSSDSFIRRSFECRWRIEGDKQKQPFISRSWVVVGDKEEVVNYEKGRTSDPRTMKSVGEVSSRFSSISFRIGGILPEPSAGGGKEIDEYRREIYDPVVDEFARFLYYVSARRGICTRSDNVDSLYRKRPDDVGLFGENTIPVLAHIQNNPEYHDCMERIRFWQKRFGLTESVASLVEGIDQPGYSLMVKNERTNVQSNIVDVGFGVNQLFSFIVQSFFAPKGSLIMIEQPEAHLHPKYQADVADLLIDIINYGNNVIVETHSEHLLLRLQRRIAERKISSKSVGVSYFELGAKGTVVSQLKMDDNGFFSAGAIPEGFFEEGFQEAFAHIKALSGQGDKVGSKK